MSLPKWIRHVLTEDGRDRVRASVRTAEKRTRGQIVPLVVRRSAGIGHVPLFLTTVLLGLSFPASRHLQAWGDHRPWLPILLVLSLFLGQFLAKLSWIQRFLTPNADRHRAAWLRAEMAFYRHGLDRTKGSTGVLLFMSIEDRQAIVLADKAIASKVPVEVWDEVCAMLTRGARQGDIANGYQAAIQRCAAALEKYFPVKGKHPNELPDKLVIEE